MIKEPEEGSSQRFSRALRYGVLFDTATSAVNVLIKVGNTKKGGEKDMSREYMLTYDLSREHFARRQPPDRQEALGAAFLLN